MCVVVWCACVLRWLCVCDVCCGGGVVCCVVCGAWCVVCCVLCVVVWCGVEHMRACCWYTRRRPDRTHGGVHLHLLTALSLIFSLLLFLFPALCSFHLLFFSSLCFFLSSLSLSLFCFLFSFFFCSLLFLFSLSLSLSLSFLLFSPPNTV